MDVALKTRDIKYLNVETWLLLAPLSKFLATRLSETNITDVLLDFTINLNCRNEIF